MMMKSRKLCGSSRLLPACPSKLTLPRLTHAHLASHRTVGALCHWSSTCACPPSSTTRRAYSWGCSALQCGRASRRAVNLPPAQAALAPRPAPNLSHAPYHAPAAGPTNDQLPGRLALPAARAARHGAPSPPARLPALAGLPASRAHLPACLTPTPAAVQRVGRARGGRGRPAGGRRRLALGPV